MSHFVSVCTSCCMSLGVVVQSLSQQLPTFLLFCDHQSAAPQCCIHLHSFCSIFVSTTHAHYRWFAKSYGLYLSHDALQVATLLFSITKIDASMLEVVASAFSQLNNVNVILLFLYWPSDIDCLQPLSPPFGCLDAYQKLEQLGEGSYATVFKGVCR